MQDRDAFADRALHGHAIDLRTNSSKVRGNLSAPIQWAVAILIFSTLFSSSAHAADVQYAYDAAGRLIGVIDQNGNPAIYNYDASGNITSIVRPAAGSLNVLGFSPASGAVGAVITITGTGFSATAAQNTVKFNGTTASISAATATQLTVSVPSGAASGTISVTSPVGTASSSQSFTVLPPVGPAPSITSFTPSSVGTGDSLTVTGANFSTNSGSESLTIGGVAAAISSTSPSTIAAVVPAGAGSGPISVTTPGGTATSSQSLYVIPGGYPASQVGSISSISITTQSISQAPSVTVGNTNDAYVFKFTGTANQRVSAVVLDGPNLTANAMLFDPNGRLLVGPVGTQYFSASDQIPAPGALLGPTVLPATGTYSVEVVPVNQTTGSTQVAAYVVPADINTTLASGQTASIPLSVPGQKATYTFTTPAANTVGLLTISSIQSVDSEILYTLTNPAGALMDSDGPEFNLGPFSGIFNTFGPYAFAQAGAYKVGITPNQAYLFNGSLFYLGFPTTASPNLTSGTQFTTPSISRGQNLVYYFQGTQGLRTTIGITNPTFGITGQYAGFNVYAPDGTLVGGYTAISAGSGIDNFGPFLLPKTGVYTVWIFNTASAAGNTGFTYYSVPADPTATLTAGGSAVTETVAAPGQNLDYTFSGTSGQRVSFNVTYSVNGGGFSQVYGTLYNPDGTQAQSFGIGNPGVVGPYTLTHTGTYKLVIQLSSSGLIGPTTGSSTVTLYNIPADPSALLVSGGAGVAESATVPGQGVDYTFSNPTVGKKATFNVSALSVQGQGGFTDCSGILYNPDGTQAQSYAFGSTGPLGPTTLSQTGTYKLVITPGTTSGLATGSMTVSLTLN